MKRIDCKEMNTKIKECMFCAVILKVTIYHIMCSHLAAIIHMP